MPVARVETAVLDAYATIALPADLRARIVARMDEAMNAATAVNADMRKRTNAELKRLSAQEDRFLDLIGDDDWPQEKIAARLRTIRDERARIARQLDHMDRPDADTGRDTLVYLTGMLAGPQELYRQAGKRARRVLNQAFFQHLYLDADDDGPHLASDELAAVIAPSSAWPATPAPAGRTTQNGAPGKGAPLPAEAPAAPTPCSPPPAPARTTPVRRPTSTTPSVTPPPSPAPPAPPL